MIQIIYNRSLSYMVTTEAGWRYDNEIVIAFISLFLVPGNYQIITLTFYCIYLQWIRYNDGIRKFVYENYKHVFCHDAQHNGKKYIKPIFTNIEVLANRTTSQNEYFISDVN